MRGLRTTALAAVLFVLILSGCNQSNIPQPTPTPKPTTLPSYASAACPFQPASDMVEGKDVTCGYLSVAADRSDPKSKTIELAVAIFKPIKTPAAPDPVIFLQGGPGGSLLDNFAPFINKQLRAQFAPDRDLIMLDQRGTGYSQPSLKCQEEYTLNDQTADENLTRDQSVQMDEQAIQKCYNRLTQSGINLNDYTTLADAADIHDLIQALGYKQANLYGVSYGTRLALTVMRLYPQGIRSVILDSSVPPQINLFDVFAKNYTRAFDVLFQGCAANAYCNGAYPNLKATFYQLVDQLNAHPITIHSTNLSNNKAYTVLLNGDSLVGWLFSALYATNLIPSLPKAIDDLSKGDAALVSESYATLVYDTTLSQGVYWSVECGEDLAFTSLPATMAEAASLAPEAQAVIDVNLKDSFGICQFWKADPVPAAQKQAVSSTIPTLIMVGEYDPIAPPANDHLEQQTLSHSYLFQFPGTGHGVIYTDNCPDSMMNAFQDKPTQQPDSSCINSMSEPNFV